MKRPGQEPAAERRVGHDPDPELARGGEDLVLDVARPQRPLRLQRGDRVDRARAAERLGRRLAEPEVAHLALLHELGHRADRLLDLRARVHAVQVVEVDVVGAEALQRALDGAPDVLARPVGDPLRRVLGRRGEADAELRGQHDLVAPAGERLAEQLLVRVRPVQLGRVEERAAELQRAVDRGDRLALVRGAVEGGHAHAAEADGRDLQVAERAGLHAAHTTTVGSSGVPDRLHFTDSDEANELIARDPLALLIGFVLDQQVTVQKAFEGPLVLRERVGVLDAAQLAAMDLEPAFRQRPRSTASPGRWRSACMPSAPTSPSATTATPRACGRMRGRRRSCAPTCWRCPGSAR